MKYSECLSLAFVPESRVTASHNQLIYSLYVVLTAVFIQNCGHGGTAYYIHVYSQRHYLSYATDLCKFIFYSFCIDLYCNELCLYIVLIWTWSLH